MFSNRKIEKLSEVNQKISEIQNKLLINMKYSSGKNDNNLIINDFLDDDESWIETTDFGTDKNTKYKPIKLYDDFNLSINSIFFKTDKGTFIESHSHVQSELCFCLDGSVKFISNGIERILKKNESIYIKSEYWHSLEFLENGTLLVMWSPKLNLKSNDTGT